MEITIIPYSNDNYAYLLSCSKTGETALVDAGEKKPILDALQKKNVDLKKILCTHHHFDHIAAVSDIKNHYSDAEVLASQNAKGKISEAKHFLKEGDIFSVGETSFEVLESFGHTQSCISYYSKQENILFSGDCLFLAGCGSPSGNECPKCASHFEHTISVLFIKNLRSSFAAIFSFALG